MHESKFYVNLADNREAETDVSIHGRTAFASMVSASRDVNENGLSFQVWMDPTCPESLQLDLSIDWYGSAGRLGFRNGIMLATFSFIVVMLVFIAQIQCYNNTGIYPHFGQGLSFCFQRTLPIVMTCVAATSVLQCVSPSTHYYTFDDLWYLPSSWQDIMTGNMDPFFWWIPLAGLVMAIGIVSLLWLIVEGLMRVLTQISLLCSAFYLFGPWPISRQQETRHQQIQRRAITTLILFVLVATFIPYQFVFVVAFLVQCVTCVRALLKSKVSVREKDFILFWLANMFHIVESNDHKKNKSLQLHAFTVTTFLYTITIQSAYFACLDKEYLSTLVCALFIGSQRICYSTLHDIR